MLQGSNSPSLAGIRQSDQEASAEKENGCSAAENSMAPAPAPVHTGADSCRTCDCNQELSLKLHESFIASWMDWKPPPVSLPIIAGKPAAPESQQQTQENQKSSRSRAREKRSKPEQEAEQALEPTEYARNRPRREIQRPQAALGHTSESLELMACANFVGPPGSGAPQAQPFRVSVHPQVTP